MDAAQIAEKMAVYDRIYEEAAAYDHLCQFKDGVCARGTPNCCVVQPGARREKCDNLDPETGCRVKTIMCKIWFCGFLMRAHPELAPKVEEWQKDARALPGVIFFQSRRDYEISLRGK